MRVHHRIPSIFNISMVDVMCCALGSVILLWLVSLREADERQREQTTLLDETKQEGNAVSARLLDVQNQIVLLEEERAAIKRQMSGQVAAALELERGLRAAQARIASLETDVEASKKRASAESMRADELTRKLTAAERRMQGLATIANTVPALQADLKSARSQMAQEAALAKALEDAMAKKALDLADITKNLQVAIQSKKVLEASLTAKEKELLLALATKEKLSASEAKIVDLEKLIAGRARELAASLRTVESLRDEKSSLQTRALRLQAEADNRFAGIALTGRRAVFLVDMSGSMDRVDPETLAPTKWLEVRNTMARIMRSLQDLEKFQVILFSTKASWPMGKEGDWLDFDPKTSVDQAFKALEGTQPEGGTHMYAGLEAAFSLRNDGLDTVYLLSDGLPNHGPGLTAEESKRLRGRDKEVERGNLLGRFILRTLRTDWNKNGKIRINSIGFFYESPDVGAFLWSLSRANGGSFVGMSNP